ncbi:hypothetical protein NBRC111894_4295 [Sporolactobacillus inulinus]|uniref:Uncharacterized protein n=1 Tax=Sporolactobacillus inulinus TaxID=2078 RepID=A0A4Y1ZIE1_9BACL|nr:hypothetical protein NBRC111894_4295 [Sporolactobacillus inulinus]
MDISGGEAQKSRSLVLCIKIHHSSSWMSQPQLLTRELNLIFILSYRES